MTKSFLTSYACFCLTECSSLSHRVIRCKSIPSLYARSSKSHSLIALSSSMLALSKTKYKVCMPFYRRTLIVKST